MNTDLYPVVIHGHLTKSTSVHTFNKWLECVKIAFNEELQTSVKEERMHSIMNELMSPMIVFRPSTSLKEITNKRFIKLAIIGLLSKLFYNFKYTRILVSDEFFAMEFDANLGSKDGPVIRGVDLLTLDTSTGKILVLEVMERPPKSMLHLQEIQMDYINKTFLSPNTTPSNL